MDDAENIPFVCVENTGRSQMAEAFFKKYASDKFYAVSAGTITSTQLNPMVIQVMKEIGIDMNDHKPKLLSNDMTKNSSKIINMGCMDKKSCPALFVKDVLDWNILDPKEKSLDDVRKIRDQIKSEVINLIRSLEE